MRRIIINCLLIISLAAAEPDGRHKRHFSFLRDLISNTLFGGSRTESPQLTNSDTESEYHLYEIPGFDDILVKAIPDAPILDKTVLNGPREVLNIEPFESYIGTKNPEDTLQAFQNVNNLLSTGILNSQQTNLMKETMVPMISSLNVLPEAKIGSFPIITDAIQPTNSEVIINPYDEKEILDDKFKPRYSYKQVETQVPLKEFAAPEVIVNQEMDPLPNIQCIDQTPGEVIIFDPNTHYISAMKEVTPKKDHRGINIQYPNIIARYIPPQPNKPAKTNIPHFGNGSKPKPAQKNVPSTPLTHFDDTAHNQHAGLANKPENKDIGKSNVNTEIAANKEPVGETGSRYVYKQGNHNNPNAFTMVKKGNELKTKVDNEPLLVKHDATVKPATKETVKNVADTAKPTESLLKQKVIEEIPEKGTLAYYIYEHENRNQPKPFSKVEADQPRSVDNSPQMIRYVYIPSDYNRLREDNLGIDVRIGSNNSPNAVNILNRAYSLTNNVHTNSPLSSQHAYISPKISTAPVSSSTIDNDDYLTNDVTASPGTVGTSTNKANEDSAPVSKEKGGNALKSNPTAVPRSKYTYHQSNPDGSSMSVKGNKDGVSVNVNEKPTKGRGDIPDQ